MGEKFKTIASIILLVVFLAPTIVKLEHDHKHITDNLKNEKQSTVFKRNCPICNFEFSVFISDVKIIDIQDVKLLSYYFNNYHSPSFSNCAQFQYSFRAPPR